MTTLNLHRAPFSIDERIAIVSHSHPSISKGGAEIAAYALFLGLRARGSDVIFVGCCPIGSRAQLELLEGEFAVFFDPGDYDHFFHLAAGSSSDQLNDILAREGVTLVNFHHYFNFGIGALREVAAHLKTVFTIHEFLAICHHHGQMITRPSHLLCERATPRACMTCFPEKTRQQFALRRRHFLDALSEVDAFVAPSHFLAARYVEWGLPQARMHVIENGLLRRSEMPSDPPRGHDHIWTFGFFGQINPFKGLSIILSACELIAARPELARRLRLRIHGNLVGQSGSFTEQFEAVLKKYRFLEYVGPYDNNSVMRLMMECDYIVVPSIWWENSPMVIQESYAARRPVICTGIGGMAEKVTDGVSGFHFRLGDPSSLTSTLEKAASAGVFSGLLAGVPKVLTSEDMASAYGEIFDVIEPANLRGARFY